MTTVAVVGVGVIGRSWARAFARGGCSVRVYDQSADQVERALRWLHADEVPPGVVAATSLDEALDGADYVQESGPEDLRVRRALFAEMDAIAGVGAVLASSTSAQDPDDFAGALAGASRCIVAHPVSPPHVIPLVEVLGTTASAGDTVERACQILAEIGSSPVRMRRYVPGFLLNRLQSALLREAIHLVTSGAATVADIDTVVRDGLGPRWAALGPFAAAHTNDDGGVAGYFTRFADDYRDEMDSLGPTPAFDAAQIEMLADGVADMLDDTSVDDLRSWRDDAITRVLAARGVTSPYRGSATPVQTAAAGDHRR